MAEHRPLSPDRVPTLTEVLQSADSPMVSAVAETSLAPASDDSALTAALLANVQVHIDSLFQARLREAIAPALARAVDGLLRELGPELAAALRDTAERAVTQELARRSRNL